jgi:carboxypeptidase family protein
MRRKVGRSEGRTEAPRAISLRGFGLLVALSLAPPVAALGAQTVTGQVVDSVSGTPVGEGFVVLLNERGREVARTLAAPDGRFTLDAPPPGAGRYRLRSERIGYVATTSPFFTLADGQTLTQSLPVRALGVRLEPIVVTRGGACRPGPEQDSATATVWEEIRKALAAAAWTADQRVYQYRVATYERDWDADRRRVLQDLGDTLVAYSFAPFAPRAPSALARQGYVVAEEDGTAFYAPDAVVLQDSAFLETHCFAVVRRQERSVSQIGLSFTPVPGRRVPDVRGALWLDEASDELRALEYRYTRLPAGQNDERIGGTIEFLRLPVGGWIVHRWQIRMPRTRRYIGIGGMVDERFDGFHDRGGEVVEIRAADRGGAIIYAR